jgi:hypothetical protein
MDKEQLRMQMLAGIITEGQYKEKMEEVDSPVLQGFNWLSNIQGKLIYGGTLEAIGNINSNTINVTNYREEIENIPNIGRDPEQLGLLLGDAVFAYLKNHIKFLIHNISDSSIRDFLENPTAENSGGDEKLLKETLQWKKWTESIPDVKDSKYLGNSEQFASMIEKPVQQMVKECTSSGGKKEASLVWGILPYLAGKWDSKITRSLNTALDKPR